MGACRTPRAIAVLFALGIGGATACSADVQSPFNDDGTGGTDGAGAAASSGSTSSTGGKSGAGGASASGGTTANGGRSSGGVTSAGGTGGAVNGGTPGTGGSATGGAPSNGGVTGTGGTTGTGGFHTGGLPGTGGFSTGGMSGTGGLSTGGKPGTGGITATGGRPGTGGITATGGTTGTGGTGNGCPCVDSSVVWMSMGGFATTSTSTVSTCKFYTHSATGGVTTNVTRPPGGACGHDLPDCDSSSINIEDLTTALAHPAVAAAAKMQPPPFFGRNGSATDQPYTRVYYGGSYFDVGQPCATTTDAACVEIPPGVAALVKVLKELDKQESANTICTAVPVATQ